MNSSGGLLDHLEALRGTLLWCVGAVVLLTVPGMLFASPLLVWYVKQVCPVGMELHYFTPLEPLIIELELGLLLGVLASLPVILLKLGEFISPGLYGHERRWCVFFVVSSLLLMGTGLVVALWAVVPMVMRFSAGYASDGLKPIIGLAGFLRMAGLLAAGFAIVFELPVALLLAIRFGLVKVETLRRRRPLLVVLLFTGAALLTPPDVVSQLLLALPGWLLFEATLLIGSWIAPREEEEAGTGAAVPAATGSGSEAAGDADAPEQGAPGSFTDDSDYRRAARKKRRIRPL